MGEVISVFEYDLLGSGKAASVGAKPVLSTTDEK